MNPASSEPGTVFLHNNPEPVFFVFFLFGLLIGLLITILMAWVYCRIFSKAGYCWALGLLMLVPIANIIMPFILAFGEWPIHKELQTLKQQKQTF